MLHDFSFKINEFTLNKDFKFKIGQWINFKKLSEDQKLWCVSNLPWVSAEGRQQILEGWYSYAIYMDIGTSGFGTTSKTDLKGSEEITFKIFPETKPSIFDNPKWVTAISTDLEVGLVEGKDYKVYKVEEDRFWVYNEVQSKTPIWYCKERFHKVTYEDVLPSKKAVFGEEEGEGFKDLVINLDAFVGGSYIVESKFSEEQLNFMQKVLPVNNPPYLILHVNNFLPAAYGFWGYKELYFNDIFKHKSEI